MIVSRACVAAALLAAMGIAGVASAQDSAPPAGQQGPAPQESDDDHIVVTGREQTPVTSGQVNRQAREITHGSDLRHSPLARFEDRLCPGIMGLTEEGAVVMIDRIRANAEKLNMWMADDTNCSPNLIIAFVDDGQNDLKRISENARWLFDTMPTAERRALLAETGPVRVWTTVVDRARDGAPIPKEHGLVDPPQVNMWMAHSKIYLPVRRDIAQVVVLFDKNGVRGKTLLQLADYATMRGLARTRPVDAAGQPMDTILALFDPDNSPPLEMTSFDRAYLAALYDGIPNIAGVTKVQGVNRALRQQQEADARAP